MKTLFTTALVAFAALGGLAQAATVNSVPMQQNDWIVFDLSSIDEQIRIMPQSADGSFSYSYAYSNTLCPTPWSCMPNNLALDTVHDGSSGNFGYSWNPVQLNNVTTETLLNAASAGQYLFFRVTSGSTSISKYMASAGISPAAVPLPASGLLVLGGLGALALLKRRRNAA